MDDEQGRAAFAGIDTHKDSHMLALLDANGGVIGTRGFPADQEGYEALEAAIGDRGVLVGIEGCRSYGAGIAEHLARKGYSVREVVRPKRQQRRRGKTDAIDAIAAARNAAAGDGLAPKEMDGALAELRCLVCTRDGFEKSMSQHANRVDSLLVTMPEGIRARYRGLAGRRRMEALSSCRPRDRLLVPCRMLAREWERLGDLVADLDARIEEIVRERCPNLLGARGIGPVSAARLMLAAGSNPNRMGGEAAFSMLCGTSPIPASSGKTRRHRLNRGGDRQANRAIHDIVYARMSFDERTRAYIAKKVSEGKSTKEAMRCLCRFVAREVFGLLTSTQVPLPDPREIAAARKRIGMSQARLAEALGVSSKKVSQMETGRSVDREFMQACVAYMESCAATACGTY